MAGTRLRNGRLLGIRFRGKFSSRRTSARAVRAHGARKNAGAQPDRGVGDRRGRSVVVSRASASRLGGVSIEIRRRGVDRARRRSRRRRKDASGRNGGVFLLHVRARRIADRGVFLLRRRIRRGKRLSDRTRSRRARLGDGRDFRSDLRPSGRARLPIRPMQKESRRLRALHGRAGIRVARACGQRQFTHLSRTPRLRDDARRGVGALSGSEADRQDSDFHRQRRARSARLCLRAHENRRSYAGKRLLYRR